MPAGFLLLALLYPLKAAREIIRTIPTQAEYRMDYNGRVGSDYLTVYRATLVHHEVAIQDSGLLCD